MHWFTTIQSFGQIKIFYVFQRSLFCSPRLHLLDQKYSKNFKNIITILKQLFLCEYMLNCHLFLWSKLYFQHHYSSLQCHMIFRNHSNMLICCSRDICTAEYVCGNCDTFYFSGFFDVQKVEKNSIYLKRNPLKHYCNPLHVFTIIYSIYIYIYIYNK